MIRPQTSRLHQKLQKLLGTTGNSDLMVSREVMPVIMLEDVHDNDPYANLAGRQYVTPMVLTSGAAQISFRLSNPVGNQNVALVTQLYIDSTLNGVCNIGNRGGVLAAPGVALVGISTDTRTYGTPASYAFSNISMTGDATTVAGSVTNFWYITRNFALTPRVIQPADPWIIAPGNDMVVNCPTNANTVACVFQWREIPVTPQP